MIIRGGEVAPVIPPGVPPILRRFWNFARDMARRFSKHLLKNREEELMKVVRKSFERGI
mgnify:CR=1 FL=1